MPRGTTRHGRNLALCGALALAGSVLVILGPVRDYDSPHAPGPSLAASADRSPQGPVDGSAVNPVAARIKPIAPSTQQRNPAAASDERDLWLHALGVLALLLLPLAKPRQPQHLIALEYLIDHSEERTETEKP